MKIWNLVAFACFATVGGVTVADGKYEATWESLNARTCPQWWRDAKFGIFIHWGVYSVPAFAPTESARIYDCYAEHYWRFLERDKKPAYIEYQRRHYPGRSYEDLAPLFTAENFNPEQWADLFRRAGAKYVVLTSKHHDGFALWPSAFSPRWNAGVLGPKRDLCGELTTAVRKAGLRMGMYYSLLEWFHPLYNDANIERFVKEINHPQMKELVQTYKPDILWTDGEWNYQWEIHRGPEFLAWLYNESDVKNHVVVNDRWGRKFNGKCGDFHTTEYDVVYEGDVSGVGAAHPWEECRGIGHSFGYNRFERAEDYMTDAQCIETLCEKVSRGGNFLLNIGPDATGLIPPIMEDRLLAMGRWLSVNGEAIYSTIAWENRPKNMKKDRVYFTRKVDALYAIFFNWPKSSVRISNAGAVKAVTLLGSNAKILFVQDGEDVLIEPPAITPGTMPCEHAWTFRLDR